MIQEAYCSFEVAKLLKEKGFDEECYQIYDGEGYLSFNHVGYINSEKPNEDFCALAPTHQMAMKWLREVHNIDIVIDASVGMLGVKVYVPFISTYKPLKDELSKVRQIKRGIYYKDDHWVIPALQNFDSYEEATEAAIKHCLENLIDYGS